MTRKTGQWRCHCGHRLGPDCSPDTLPSRCEEKGCVCAQCAGAHTIAFTVGSRSAYADLSLGSKKTGRHGPTEEDPAGYEGGIVFRDAASATAWIERTGAPSYGVYRLALPLPWEECVDENGPYPAILVDCHILGPA